MQYVRARYLDVQAGRWVSRDPIGYDGGDWNLYRYVWNDALRRLDPSGQICEGLEAALKKELGQCYQSKYATLLATVFACIADAESSCQNDNSMNDNNGLFQMSCVQFHDCASKDCGICKKYKQQSKCQLPSDWKNTSCQIHAAVNFLKTVCSDHPNISLCDALVINWGTVRGQNPQFWKCITKAQCKLLKNTSCSTALKGKCKRCKSNYKQSRFTCKNASIPQCSAV